MSEVVKNYEWEVLDTTKDKAGNPLVEVSILIYLDTEEDRDEAISRLGDSLQNLT